MSGLYFRPHSDIYLSYSVKRCQCIVKVKILIQSSYLWQEIYTGCTINIYIENVWLEQNYMLSDNCFPKFHRSKLFTIQHIHKWTNVNSNNNEIWWLRAGIFRGGT